MNYISTGEPSTLGTYKKIAKCFGENALNFIQKEINRSEDGEDEEVIVEESQMLVILASVK